jgi:tetratricopeptide (TPR) repeat protein
MPLATPATEAVPLLEEALRLKKSKLGPNSPSTLGTEYWLAMRYLQTGREPKALPLCEENFKHRKDIYGRDHSLTLRSMGLLARALTQNGRPMDGLRLGEEAWELSKVKLGADHLDTLMYLGDLAHSHLVAKQPQKAIALYNEFLGWQGKRYQSGDPRLAQAHAVVAADLLGFGQFTEAEKVLRECLAIRENSQPDLWMTFHTRSLLGGALLAQKKYTEAEPLLRKGYEGMRQREAKIPANAKSRLTEALDRLVQLYDATGQKDKADEWRRKLDGARAGPNPPTKP